MNLNDLFETNEQNDRGLLEGRTKELAMDLEDPAMSDEEFETKYGDSRANMQHRAGRVQDRKTGRFYDPEQEFDRLKNSPEFGAQMRRMAQQEGVAEGRATYGPVTDTHKAAAKKAFAAGERDGKAGAEKNKQYMSSALMKTTYLNGYKQGKQGVAEAGNRPVDRQFPLGTGDTRTPRDIKSQMQGASDEFVRSTADKKTGPFHSRVAKMQGKLAKSELRRREQGVAKKPQPYHDPNWIKNLPKEKLDAIRGKKYQKPQPDIAEDSKEKSDPWTDPKLKRKMDYAFGHYAGYKDRPEAFFKWVMQALEHSEQQDQEHEERFQDIDRAISSIKKRLDAAASQKNLPVSESREIKKQIIANILKESRL